MLVKGIIQILKVADVHSVPIIICQFLMQLVPSGHSIVIRSSLLTDWEHATNNLPVHPKPWVADVSAAVKIEQALNFNKINVAYVSRLSDNRSSSVCVFFTTNLGLIFKEVFSSRMSWFAMNGQLLNCFIFFSETSETNALMIGDVLLKGSDNDL